MNPQDKSFLITFTTVISVLVLIAVAIFLASRMVSLITVEAEDDARRTAAIEQRIKPVAMVAVAEPTVGEVGPATPMTGQEVYESVCASCHGTGVLNAPRFGSSDDWAPRFEQGLDTLVTHAVNGIRAMPAKGGNPNLSEQEVKNSIVYMLRESGIEVSEEVTAIAEAPAEAAAAPLTADVPPKTAIEPPPAATADLEHGKQIYSQVCFVCHEGGLAGAPKMGDEDAWQARYQQGFETLVNNAVNGIRGMPPKGGNPTLSEDDIRDAVAYMLEESGIAIPAPTLTAEELPPAEAAPAEEKPAPEVEAAKPVTVSDQVITAIEQAAAAAQQAAEASQKAADAIQQAAEAVRKSAAPEQSAPEQEAAPEPAPAEEKPAQEEAPAPEKPAPEQTQEQAAPAEEKSAASEQTQEQAAPAEEKATAAEGKTPAAEKQVAAQAKVDQPAEVTPESPPIQLPETVELALGKQVYDSACVICHEAGVAGAPKFGSESDWAPRLAKGFETLLQHAVNGFKGMPPKGGRPDLTPEQIGNAIGYMVSNAR